MCITGHNDVLTTFCHPFSTFGKFVIMVYCSFLVLHFPVLHFQLTHIGLDDVRWHNPPVRIEVPVKTGSLNLAG